MTASRRDSARSARFDFTDEAPARWAERLDALGAEGVTHVETRLFWGAHESLRGTPDFSKASRLRLERFLQTVQEAGLTVEVAVGFPSGRETLPEWTHTFAEKTLVPGALCGREDLGAVTVPSPYHTEFRAAFADYLAEALAVLGLYRHPDGPLTNVRLDFGLFEHDLCAMESDAFRLALEDRYRSIADLNLCYATAFKTFASVSSRQGLRVLNDKRAWLAAFDYKWCRGEALREWREELLALEPAKPLLDLLDPGPAAPAVRRGLAPWQILFDPALLEVPSDGGDPCAPFSPAGFVNEASAMAFRLYEYVAEGAKSACVGVDWLPLWAADEAPEGRVLVVVCGKYLSSAAFSVIEMHLQGGGGVLFPLVLPQYDEQMRSHPWVPLRERVAFHVEQRSLSRFDIGAGRGWAAAEPLPMSDGLWNDIATMATALVRDRGASA